VIGVGQSVVDLPEGESLEKELVCLYSIGESVIAVLSVPCICWLKTIKRFKNRKLCERNRQYRENMQIASLYVTYSRTILSLISYICG
jgi:hypothetical protein